MMRARLLLVVLALAACKKKDDKTPAQGGPPKAPLATTADAGPAKIAVVQKREAPEAVNARESEAGARGTSVKEALLKQALAGPTASGAIAPGLGENVVAAPALAMAQPKVETRGEFKLVVEPGPETPVRAGAIAMLTKLLEGMNRTLRLPRDIPVLLGKCGTINAFYNPKEQNIRVCDELLDFYVEVFSQYKPPGELQKTILGSLLFVFLHEMGHCLIDQFQIPSTGREEDAVDQLATVLLIAGGEQTSMIAMTGGESFLAMNVFSAGGPNHTPYWDEHSFDEQRFYNIVCLVFGSNPEKFEDFIKEGDLPMARAVRCPSEFKKIYGAWDKLITPFTVAQPAPAPTPAPTPAPAPVPTPAAATP